MQTLLDVRITVTADEPAAGETPETLTAYALANFNLTNAIIEYLAKNRDVPPEDREWSETEGTDARAVWTVTVRPAGIFNDRPADEPRGFQTPAFPAGAVKMTFDAVPRGGTFYFAREIDEPGTGMASGPWRKTSARKYVPSGTPGKPMYETRIGSAKVYVYAVNGGAA